MLNTSRGTGARHVCTSDHDGTWASEYLNVIFLILSVIANRLRRTWVCDDGKERTRIPRSKRPWFLKTTSDVCYLSTEEPRKFWNTGSRNTTTKPLAEETFPTKRNLGHRQRAKWFQRRLRSLDSGVMSRDERTDENTKGDQDWSWQPQNTGERTLAHGDHSLLYCRLDTERCCEFLETISFGALRHLAWSSSRQKITGPEDHECHGQYDQGSCGFGDPGNADSPLPFTLHRHRYRHGPRRARVRERQIRMPTWRTCAGNSKADEIPNFRLLRELFNKSRCRHGCAQHCNNTFLQFLHPDGNLGRKVLSIVCQFCLCS
jgi:hypothetical protein